jgi:hypothetical protein
MLHPLTKAQSAGRAAQQHEEILAFPLEEELTQQLAAGCDLRSLWPW